MIDALRALFPISERWRLALVFGVAFLVAVFETLGVASIAPFLTAMLDPQALERMSVVGRLLGWLGADTLRARLLTMGALTIGAIAFGNAVAVAGLVVQSRFAARTSARVSTVLFRGYLMSPYAFHIQRDAPSLLKVLGSDVGMLGIALSQIQTLVSRGLILVALTSLLLWQNPQVALSALVLLGATYALVYRQVRTRQGTLGAEVSEAREARARLTQEGLGGIKELQVLGREAVVVRAAGIAFADVADADSEAGVITQLPRYLLETIAYGGLIAVAIYLLADGSTVTTAIPTLALYVFAAYRLLPAMQQLYGAVVTLRYVAPSVDALVLDWRAVVGQGESPIEPGGAPVDVDSIAAEAPPPPLLEVRNVTFRYPQSPRVALHEVSMTIPPGASVGIVGRTGSGKTTLVDLLLGLHGPDLGAVLVDGVPLDEAGRRRLRRTVGYVPQQVFLANASIAQNIAFAVDDKRIDREAVWRAAQLAQADEFITELTDGIDTVVGERGVRLSGGQRQRLGIARALYHRPSVLVFDEATSALDGLTEEALMAAIRLLAGTRTVILIAHRLRTVSACDRILVLEEGRVVGDGAWDALLDDCAEFRALVGGAAMSTTG